MKTRLNEIHEYLLKTGSEKEDLNELDTHSVYLAMEIAEYAHREQKRVNGERYVNHPFRCLNMYRKLVGIKPDDYYCIDKDLMIENGIPFDGVQEVCLLHDVLEDTDFSFEDVRNIYVECGFERYFDLYIAEPLKNITHDKSTTYDEYIPICLKHPTSALVKMIDMQDNLNVLDLDKFDEENYKRAKKYLENIYIINAIYYFIEKSRKYLEEFANKK